MSSPADLTGAATVPLDAALLRAWPMPVRQGGDKFARGTAVVVGGSPRTPGAVRLAGEAALRMGAGRLQIATASRGRGHTRRRRARSPRRAARGRRCRRPAVERHDTSDFDVAEAEAVLVGPRNVERGVCRDRRRGAEVHQRRDARRARRPRPVRPRRAGRRPHPSRAVGVDSEPSGAANARWMRGVAGHHRRRDPGVECRPTIRSGDLRCSAR